MTRLLELVPRVAIVYVPLTLKTLAKLLFNISALFHILGVQSWEAAIWPTT